jgi:hypothetical protein
MNSFEKCFDHIEDNPFSAAECIHCLKKNGETVFFDEKQGRLVLGREMYDARFVDKMKKLTDILGIHNREDYDLVDKEYNLTMY